jgi:hypothetical protein
VSPSHTNQIAILNRLIILISSSISIIRVLAFVELINTEIAKLAKIIKLTMVDSDEDVSTVEVDEYTEADVFTK